MFTLEAGARLIQYNGIQVLLPQHAVRDPRHWAFSFIHSIIHSFIHSFVHSFVHSFIHCSSQPHPLAPPLPQDLHSALPARVRNQRSGRSRSRWCRQHLLRSHAWLRLLTRNNAARNAAAAPPLGGLSGAAFLLRCARACARPGGPVSRTKASMVYFEELATAAALCARAR